MTSQKVLGDCQFCSVISKANKEDPIGTVNKADIYLIMETPLPWTEQQLLTNPVIKQVLSLLKELQEKNIRAIPMAIAPDKEYSVSEYTRVIFYQRPAQSFAKFEKQEFLIPQSQLTYLVTALLKHPDKIHQFESYRQPSDCNRELMICTHGNVDAACARFGFPIYQKLRQDYAAKSEGQLRVWRCSHFGGHQFAPTCLDLPTGQFWGHLEPEILDTLVQRNSAVTQLRQFYRGWSGLTKFEQIVEREIWMKHGWEWLNYQKSGQVIAQDTANEDADWAEVRIDFISPDSNTQGSYEAKVEVCGSVMTALNSGKEQPLQSVKQYRVTQLKKY
ncbi:MAG: sucrase ferredoxin [Cyanobacteria bacterium P01_A01_bin.68]